MLALVAMLASCDVQIDHVDDGGKAVDSTAVGFGAYVYRGVSTKAGWNDGVLTGETIKNPEAGFGVFGYASQSLPYNERSKPDFMYNQPVKHPSDRWTYEPVKYWPNEETASVSFFAYAPFVEVNPSTGVVSDNSTDGIIGMTHHLAEGDPQVWYSTTLTPGNDVDLCWGIPFLNEKKRGTGERLQFEFHHALSQLNVQIDTDSDAASQAAEETRIYVRSVTFTGFAIRGSLNLNSVNAPIWNDISGTERPRREPVTVYDGRIDGAEGRIGSIDAGEKLATLNPAIIQSAPYDVNVIDGVTGTTVNLFQNNNELEAPVLVIPLTGTPLSVTIVYDVETADDELTGFLSDGVTHGISVENRITQEVKLDDGTPMTLEAGKKYIVNLHLGLTGVKFSAEMTAWDDKEYGKADMPANMYSFDIGLSKRSSTIWRNETPDLPVVTIRDKTGTDVTSQSVLRWESDNTSVASVTADGSEVHLGGTAGVAHIKVTAEYDNYSKSDTYSLFVNEVTGISISPSETRVEPNRTVTLAAEITHTEHGTINSLPTFTWSSDDTNIASLGTPSAIVDRDGVATSTVVATGVSLGDTKIKAAIEAGYMKSGVSALAECVFHCLDMTTGKFRGYDVSPGILYKKSDGTYGMTNQDGSDPFEIERYFGVQSSIGVYYHYWGTLRNYFGADANGNIKSDSPLLPVDSEGHRWMIPSNSVWETILNGRPKAPITVNGQNVTTGYSLVTINYSETVSYQGLLLIPDGLPNIECDHLLTFGRRTKFSDNVLTTAEFDYLKTAGCLFLDCSGIYETNWWHSKDEGDYFTANCEGKSERKPLYMKFTDYVGATSGYTYTTSTGQLPCMSVRLVRLATDN